jgi:hypothetical protein
MLETIVQDEHLRAKILKGPLAGGGTIGITDHRSESFKILREQKWLVTSFRGGCQHCESI